MIPKTIQAATAADGMVAKFGILSDIQYADADAQGERDFRASLPKLRVAVDALNRQNLQYTLHLGDLIDHDWQSFEPVMEELSRLAHPLHHVLGNHDLDVDNERLSSVPAKLGLPSNGYRAFGTDNLRFIILDTNELSLYRHPPESASWHAAQTMLAKLQQTGAVQAKPWNGAVSAKQLAWLEEELSDAERSGQQVLVCGHHPLVSDTGHHAWNGDAILNVLLRHHAVCAYLCGHQHNGGVALAANGMPMITFRSLLGPPEVNAWAVLTLTRSSLVIEAWGREISRTFTFPSKPTS